MHRVLTRKPIKVVAGSDLVPEVGVICYWACGDNPELIGTSRNWGIGIYQWE